LVEYGKSMGVIAAASSNKMAMTAALRTRSLDLGRAFLGGGTLVLKGIP
jgi:hypothetical protein